MEFVRALQQLLRRQRFRQLFAVRVTSQASDGVLQVALASYVLFSPEKQPDAASIAGALAVVLLPFSVLGPFVGVFLDRWSRRQVLVIANLVRLLPVLTAAALIAFDAPDVALLVAVLIAFSINRFFLAGLSAALPHVVADDELVLANSITPTSGTIAFMIGLGAASVARGVLPGPDPDATVVCLAALGYLAAAALALRLPREQLGPDQDAADVAVAEALHHVARGLLAGLRHLRSRPAASQALMVIAAHRFCYGLTTVATILLFRNYFYSPDDADAALAGLSVALLLTGAGYFTAAVITPVVTRHWPTQRWIIALLLTAAVVQAFPGGLFEERTVMIVAFVLGISAQGIKICVDTLVQTHVDDAYRGRVFSIYDVVFNAVFVAAAAVAAMVVPSDGRSLPVLALICSGYLLAAALYGRAQPVGSPLSAHHASSS